MDIPAQNSTQPIYPNQTYQNPSGTYYAPNTPPQNNKGLKELLLLEVGIGEILFVVLILAVLFGTLNFFNILSLSTLYPKTFGWLPHIINADQNKTYTKTVVSVGSNSRSVNGNTYYSNQLKMWVTRGVLEGFNSNSLKIANSEGVSSYSLTPITVFITVNDQNMINGSAGAPSTSQSLNLNQLTDRENIGKHIEVYFITDKTTGEKTLQNVFISEAGKAF